jgi:hypothetical protein
MGAVGSGHERRRAWTWARAGVGAGGGRRGRGREWAWAWAGVDMGVGGRRRGRGWGRARAGACIAAVDAVLIDAAIPRRISHPRGLASGGCRRRRARTAPGRSEPDRSGPSRPSQVGPSQVGPSQVRPSQVRPSQVRLSQVGPGQVGPGQVGPGQVGPGQVGPGQVNADPVGYADYPGGIWRLSRSGMEGPLPERAGAGMAGSARLRNGRSDPPRPRFGTKCAPPRAGIRPTGAEDPCDAGGVRKACPCGAMDSGSGLVDARHFGCTGQFDPAHRRSMAADRDGIRG